jgi:carbonic anhydrase
MDTIDLVYRFDPRNPVFKPPPWDAVSARKMLEDGNRTYARWMESCRAGDVPEHEREHVVPCTGLDFGMNPRDPQVPKQVPFAVVVGCSDARVPIELLFGQGFNNLFVIRVAGNVLGDVCLGSVDYALHHLSDSIKCVVVLGHLGCGAVTAAVDAYLQPHELWTKAVAPVLRSIIHRIFAAVCEADHAIKQVWGENACEKPNYRKTLIDIAVCVNAAQAAYDLSLEVERAAKRHIDTVYGVFNLINNQVSMPVDPRAPFSPVNVNLAHAPASPKEFHDLAARMADLARP